MIERFGEEHVFIQNNNRDEGCEEGGGKKRKQRVGLVFGLLKKKRVAEMTHFG